MTSSPFARPVATVDGQLETLCALQVDCRDQLASVRRQLMELQSHELNLLTAYANRERRIDLLLDERLLARENENGALV